MDDYRAGHEPSATTECSRHATTLWALAIASAVFAAYSNTFDAPFLRDDVLSIVNNPSIRRPWRPEAILLPPRGTTVEGRPVLNASLALCYAIGSLDVLPYRIFNISVHALAALVLFGLARRTLETARLRPVFGAASLQVAASAAALWALHPLHTSCVTYIIQRAESLAGLFYLATIYCVVRAAGDDPQDRGTSADDSWRPRAATAAIQSRDGIADGAGAPVSGSGAQPEISAEPGVSAKPRDIRPRACGQTLTACPEISEREGCHSSPPGPAPGVFGRHLSVLPEASRRESGEPRALSSEPGGSGQAPSPRANGGGSPAGCREGSPRRRGGGREDGRCSAPTGWTARRLWGAAAVASCWLGIGTKEIVATAPLMALLYDRIFLSGSFAAALRRQPAMYAGLAASWSLLALELAANNFHTSTIGPIYGTISLPEQLMTQTRAVVWYLRLAVWPSPLIFDYGPWDAGGPAIRSPVEWAPWGIALLALLAAAAAALRLLPAAGFAGAWFFVTLAPSSSLVPIPTEVVAEYRMYLPLAALCVLAAAGLRVAVQALGLRPPLPTGPPVPSPVAPATQAPSAPPRQALHAAAASASWLIPAVAAVLLGAATWARNADYGSALTIWSDTVRKRPSNPRAHTDLGVALASAGRYEEAVAAHREAIRLKPDMEEAWNNLGNVLAAMGAREEAANCYMRIIRSNPRNVAARSNLGAALLEMGRLAEAERAYREALAINPEYVPALSGLAALLAMSGREAGAAELYAAALRICPDDTGAQINLAMALTGSGRPAEALPLCVEARRRDPRLPEAHFAEGVALEALGRREEAAARYREALRLSPAFTAARDRLARIERPAR
ncbi:MAG: tetratricopeptide repeat protein [Planctomycetota bacterium]|nr:tetratricopeptide repeat protein [Planctomycetota bacterium]